MSNLLIVESPAKAKSIASYLGSTFQVLASYGHVRDLEPKTKAVNPEQDFQMSWVTSSTSKKHIDKIITAAQKADTIYLATDPDREGEAIAWHIVSILQEKKTLTNHKVLRATFHEISKESVTKAIQNARPQLNQPLIDAYLARRCLDFLVGFHISPILWRKVPACRSAGRVQSAALRLICEKTLEIEKFKPQEYWSFSALFSYATNATLEANLAHIQGKPLKHTVTSEKDALAVSEKIQELQYAVDETQEKQVSLSPAPPFITSTLQQTAYKKFGWSASKVMQVAQSLYEGVNIQGQQKGLITYMRTDSTRIEPQFVAEMRDYIAKTFSKEHVPSKPVAYKNSTKNAQEAHEAIRPTSLDLPPSLTYKHLSEEQQSLFELIWCRAISSQMAPAKKKVINLVITDKDKQFTFKATESFITFPGYLALYRPPDHQEPADSNTSLPKLGNNTQLPLEKITPNQHFTKPPAYFNEASLIQALEENGIGRPSTYAPTIQTLFKRAYVEQNKKQLHPTLAGRVLTLFLKKYLSTYVEYDFTANMESTLDDIACDNKKWLDIMRPFWGDLKQNTLEAKDINPNDLSTEALQLLEHVILPPLGLTPDTISCTKCQKPLSFKGSRYGFFLGCTGYPDCNYIVSVGGQASEEGAAPPKEPVKFGVHPDTDEPILLKSGPYGPYLESGQKRVGLTPKMAKAEMTEELMFLLLSLPKALGNFEDQVVDIRTGRFGPYVKCGKDMASVPVEELATLSLDQAIKYITDKREQPSKKAPRKKK